MAFPQVAATNTATQTASTNHTVNLPTGIVSGNLLIVVMWCDNNLVSHTYPGDWTRILHETATPCSSVAYRIADGLEASTITVTTSASVVGASASARITSWHGTTAPEVTARATGTNASPNPGSLTPSWGSADTLWMPIAWDDDDAAGQTTDAYPYASNNITSRVSATNGGAVSFCTTEVAAASLDSGAFTMSDANQWGAATLAVRPAAGSGSNAKLVKTYLG